LKVAQQREVVPSRSVVRATRPPHRALFRRFRIPSPRRPPGRLTRSQVLRRDMRVVREGQIGNRVTGGLG
jgi:hypothetical protein